MADVAVETAASFEVEWQGQKYGPVWAGNDTGYIFYANDANDIKYRKTTDGGASWGAAVDVGGAITVSTIDVWFDKWTPGDSGTLIHIWWMDIVSDDVHYRTLDTASDTLGTLRTVFSGVTFLAANREQQTLSGVKAVGGNLYVQFWGDRFGERGFYRSIDSGANWTSRTDGADGDDVDEILCLPDDDSADNQDIVMIYWDRSANEISIKKYDNSGNSWGETSISGGMAASNQILQMSAVVRHSDGHIILAAWTVLDANGDLKVWDITLATPTITAKTSVVTTADDCVCVGLFIDQNTDDLYCAYLGDEDGSETYQDTLTAFYKKSEDGAGTWGAQQAYQEGAADDERYICAGHSTPGNAAGRFEPVFFNDDLRDLFVNKVNSVEITVGAGPQAITGSGIASLEAFGSAQLNLGFTATGIASSEAFGAPTVTTTVTITAGAIPSAEAFGAAQLNLAFTASGIASAEAFGSAIVTLGLTLSPSGIASLEAFGAATISTGAVTLSPSGIPSLEAFGSAQLDLTFTASGIASLESFGSATVTPGAVTLSPSGIATAEVFGAATVTPGVVTLLPSGIASTEAFGSATVAIAITAGGIASAETFGSATITTGVVTITASGIASLEGFGAATVAAGVTGPMVIELEASYTPIITFEASDTPIIGQAASYTPIIELEAAQS